MPGNMLSEDTLCAHLIHVLCGISGVVVLLQPKRAMSASRRALRLWENPAVHTVRIYYNYRI